MNSPCPKIAALVEKAFREACGCCPDCGAGPGPLSTEWACGSHVKKKNTWGTYQSPTCRVAQLKKELSTAQSALAESQRIRGELAYSVGVAQGQLAASESAAVTQGWKSRAEKAESALAEREREYENLNQTWSRSVAHSKKLERELGERERELGEVKELCLNTKSEMAGCEDSQQFLFSLANQILSILKGGK